MAGQSRYISVLMSILSTSTLLDYYNNALVGYVEWIVIIPKIATLRIVYWLKDSHFLDKLLFQSSAEWAVRFMWRNKYPKNGRNSIFWTCESPAMLENRSPWSVTILIRRNITKLGKVTHVSQDHSCDFVID